MPTVNIKNGHVYEFAKALSERTGRSMTSVIEAALEQPLADLQQVQLARRAYRASGHPARLDFGDCFSSALAMDKREPLLFKGDDFNHTDVLVAS